MIRASLYITACSAKNRARRWVKRLREPRYLVGALAAAAYVYLVVFRNIRRGRRGRSVPPDFIASLQPAGGALVGLWVLVMAAAAWLFPFESGLLDFSPAEVEFLFPAPVSRRQLLVHRLVRSQVGLALAGIIPALLIPFGSGGARVRFAVAIWVMTVTGKLYTTGVTLTRTRGIRRAWLPPALVAVASGVVGVSVGQAVVARPFAGVAETVQQIGHAVTSGAARVALIPLTALGAPLFADTAASYLAAIALAGVVMAANLVWVLRADEALQDAAESTTARRERKAREPASRARSRAAAWTLATTGRPEMVFAWKAASQTFRAVDRRTIVRLLAIVAALVALALTAGRSRGIAGVMGLIGLGGTAYVVLLAPQILRIDLRQDLQRLEWLKTWPVRSAAVVRGELVWPGVLLSALAWILLLVGVATSAGLFPSASVALRLSAAAGALVMVPALVFTQLTIHNAVVLVFPGWASLGRQRARGFDAIGQRLITLGGTWMALLAALLPAVLVGGIVWFALSRLVGVAAIVPGAMTVAAVLLLEVSLATEALGRLLDKVDITSVEKGE